MKIFITKKWFVLSLASVFLLGIFVFYVFRITNRYIYTTEEIEVSRLDEIPYIGDYLKEIESEGDIRYVEKNTLGTIEILFTGHISNESVKKLSESNDWDYISAAVHIESLGNIYKDFNVAKDDYPVSYTDDDIMFGRPLFENIKVKMNYITRQNRFTGKATIYNR